VAAQWEIPPVVDKISSLLRVVGTKDVYLHCSFGIPSLAFLFHSNGKST
jgi:hypothetical protein